MTIYMERLVGYLKQVRDEVVTGIREQYVLRHGSLTDRMDIILDREIEDGLKLEQLRYHLLQGLQLGPYKERYLDADLGVLIGLSTTHFDDNRRLSSEQMQRINQLRFPDQAFEIQGADIEVQFGEPRHQSDVFADTCDRISDLEQRALRILNNEDESSK